MEKYECIAWNIITSLLKELSSNQLQTQPQSINDGTNGTTNNNKNKLSKIALHYNYALAQHWHQLHVKMK